MLPPPCTHVKHRMTSELQCPENCADVRRRPSALERPGAYSTLDEKAHGALHVFLPVFLFFRCRLVAPTRREPSADLRPFDARMPHLERGCTCSSRGARPGENHATQALPRLRPCVLAAVTTTGERSGKQGGSTMLVNRVENTRGTTHERGAGCETRSLTRDGDR